MGASAREIERQIKETRARMDDNLTRLERQASTRAVRYAKVAAVVLALAAAGGAAYLLYRRAHRPTLRDRLGDVSVGRLRTLVAEAPDRLRERLPSVTVRFNEKTVAEPGAVESILRELTPALIGTAGTALLQRVATRPEE